MKSEQVVSLDTCRLKMYAQHILVSFCSFSTINEHHISSSLFAVL